jgi:hypothetical protein
MPVIDLRGPDGNAFYLMGMVRGWARQLDMDPAPIIADMRSGDYAHLLTAMEEGFPFLDIEFRNDPRNPDRAPLSPRPMGTCKHPDAQARGAQKRGQGELQG